MESIGIKAYAKINLSLDVIEKLSNGYHKVEMVMHQIDLKDLVSIRWIPYDRKEDIEIEVKTNRPYLPTDNRNLAYKAAELMAQKYGGNLCGKIRIDIKKNIPVAAGLAGGSGNGAAVIHGLNMLWNRKLSLKELCDIGAELGSDVPFTIMGQAAANKQLQEIYGKDNLAASCAIAEGTGTELKPEKSIKAFVLLSKPPISVSTAEVYQGLNLEKLGRRPDNKELIKGLKNRDFDLIKDSMANVLESYTLKRYPVVAETKEIMEKICKNSAILMSGSGPSVFAIGKNREELAEAFNILKGKNKETYLMRTIV